MIMRPGTRFGKLLVLNTLRHKVDETHWRSRVQCRCDCGNVKLYIPANLKKGGTNSCGCGKANDLTGGRFGKLLALRRGSQTAQNKVRWVCRCDCGRETEVIGTRLVTGRQRSCGCMMGFKGRPLADLFWTKVSRGPGCWNWTGHLNRKGYAVVTAVGHPELVAISKTKRVWLASRVSWVLTHGTVPSDKLVCHRCDNPACVRPSHLFLGSHQDNVDDMVKKGRGFWQK